MSQLRIIDTNEILTATITAFSEQASFPKENIQNPLRPRVWRSETNYDITAANNAIDFDEGGGELNATVAALNYDAAGLATAIKTALEAAGAETYTVTYSSTTGKWTLTSDTGGTFSLLWSTGTNTATTIGGSIGFDTSSDDTAALTYTGDFIAIHTTDGLIFDLGSAKSIDSFVLVFDAVDGSKFTSSAIIRLLGNSVNAWGAPPVDVTVGFDSTYETFSHFFTTPEVYQFWRIFITDPQNPNIFIELSKVILGGATQLTQLPQIGFQDIREDQSDIFRTKFGQKYADIYPIIRSMVFSYSALDKVDSETLQQLWEVHGIHTPLTIVLDPLATTFDKDRFLIYGCFMGSLEATNVFNQFFDTEFEIIEAL